MSLIIVIDVLMIGLHSYSKLHSRVYLVNTNNVLQERKKLYG